MKSQRCATQRTNSFSPQTFAARPYTVTLSLFSHFPAWMRPSTTLSQSQQIKQTGHRCPTSTTRATQLRICPTG